MWCKTVSFLPTRATPDKQSLSLVRASGSVLSWFQSTKLKPLVANHVQEIKRITASITWKCCPTSDNPADPFTRAIKIPQYTASPSTRRHLSNIILINFPSSTFPYFPQQFHLISTAAGMCYLGAYFWRLNFRHLKIEVFSDFPRTANVKMSRDLVLAVCGSGFDVWNVF